MNATPLGQLLGIERGNPLGILVLLTTTLVTLGWWIYSAPGRRAAKALIEFRAQMIAWQANETARYDAMWEENLELRIRCEALEGKLARWKAEYQIRDDSTG